MARKLKGLRRYEEAGQYKIKHRASGISMPAHLAEDHPEFLEAYLAAEKAAQSGQPRRRQKITPGSIEDVFRQLALSDKWKSLSDIYRGQMDRHLRAICATQGGRAGRVPITAIKPEHIAIDMDRLNGHDANARRKAWSLLMRFAVSKRMRFDNPAAVVAKIELAPHQQHPSWTAEEITMVRDRWAIGTDQRLAFELLFWTGARAGDVLRMGTPMLDRHGWLTFRQSKTKRPVAVPVFRDPPAFANPEDQLQLRAAIEASPKRRDLVWLTTEAGAPRSVKGGRQWLNDVFRAADVVGKTAHGLRVTRAILLAEGGGQSEQRRAWLGHVTDSEAAHYAQAADLRRVLGETDGERNLFDVTEIEQKRTISD
ncbi:tyrosine-type recombinase/integrase [Roseovarius nubinhibens]|tara:strand:+ start:10938 stop:12044 length:1107 start_codon:yes stop_codon:yes gene_type:complete